MVRYDKAVRDLQLNDRNATWHEVLSECDGNYFRARKQLVMGLEQAIEQNVGVCKSAVKFYRSIIDSL